MKKLAKDKMLRALSNVAYAKGDYEKEVGDVYKRQEATGFQRCKGVFLTPHPVDFIEILRADGSIRFQSDVSLRLHEIKDIVAVSYTHRCV